MALKWDGFSEEDINALKLRSSKTRSSDVQADNISSKNGCRQPKVSMSSNEHVQANSDTLTKSKPCDDRKRTDMAVEVYSQLESLKCGSYLASCNNTSTQEFATDCDNSSSSLLTHSKVEDSQKKSLTAKLVIPSLSQPPPSSINLNDFKTKHKLMEEQNRARKVFLAKALEDRKKQTHAEHIRLSMIQEELQKLDQRLSCDVSIIRNQIEASSLEFMEAQKRYDRAEKEFLDAKLHLYTKLERKELLTHHLCTIIEQNEMRKAQKLSELMEKLQMPESDTPQILDESLSKEQDTLSTVQPTTDAYPKVSSEIILMPTLVCGNSNEASKSFEDHENGAIPKL